MSAANNFTFVTPEEVVARGQFFPYWEIRDEGNRLLKATRPPEGELIIGKFEHNNPEGINLEQAVRYFVESGRGLFQFIRIKLGTKYNATSNYSYFAINLTDKTNEELASNFYFPNNNQVNNNPNVVYLNGKNQPQEQNPTNYLEALALLQQKMEANLEKRLMEMEMSFQQAQLKLGYEELNKKEEELERRRREWEKNKKEELLKASETGYSMKDVVKDAPTIVEALAGLTSTVVSLVKGQEIPLAGKQLQKEETKEVKPERKKTKISLETEDGQEDLTGTGSTEEKEKKKTEEPAEDFLCGLTPEQIEALKASAAALKSGKIHQDELKQVVDNPDEFFDPAEEDENKTE